MSSWNPFGKSGLDSPQTLGLENMAQMEVALRNQRAVIQRILAALMGGSPLVLEDEPIRSFLGLSAGLSAEDALQSLLRSQARVLGMAPCPKCGAAVQDIEGVTNERCPWCGAELQTAG